MNAKGYFIIGLVVVLAIVIVYAGARFFISTTSQTNCAGQSAEQRDACCVSQEASVNIIECRGTWKFNLTSEKCYYSCTVTHQLCTQDAKQCPDGSFVGRDSNNNCEFKPCPGT